LQERANLAREVAEALWIKRQPASNAPLVTALRLELDTGEAEAITLAVESGADLVLLDERLGRRAASARRTSSGCGFLDRRRSLQRGA
jgi:predicted nucleic acid-binding protein